MSKVVTIPTSQSPFVVMVNGAKYVFPAGSVQEVPDEVAIVIEAYSRETPAKPVDAPFDCCEGGGSSGTVQSDWNQTDSSAADFIKNKPFGDSKTVIVPQGDVLFPFSEEDGGCVAAFENVEPVLDGDKIEVIWDGIAYSGTAISQFPLIIFGNIGLMLGGDDTGEPYVGMYGEGTIALFDATATEDVTHNVAISRYSPKTIAERYLPEPKFYYSSADQYIYMDIGLTVKATVSDIPDNAVFSVGRVVSRGVLADAWFHPFMVYSGAAVPIVGYGIVRIMNGGEIINLFTAEFTPEA